jgi:hypothetical protein
MCNAVIDHISMATHWEYLALSKQLPPNVFPTSAFLMKKFDNSAARVITSNASEYNNPPVPQRTVQAHVPHHETAISGHTTDTEASRVTPFHPTNPYGSVWGVMGLNMRGYYYPQPVFGGSSHVAVHIPPTTNVTVSTASVDTTSLRGKSSAGKMCDYCGNPRIGTHGRSGCPYVCNVCRQQLNACTCLGGPTIVEKKT